MSEILEATMIIFFGISWPMNIIKSIRTKTTKGKSLVFLIFIFMGYIAGVASKILSGNITYVFVFYVLNLIMVGADIVLYYFNHKRDVIHKNNKIGEIYD